MRGHARRRGAWLVALTVWSSLAADKQLLRGCGDTRGLAVADVDKDGFDDVVMPCKQTGIVHVAYGDKSGITANRSVRRRRVHAAAQRQHFLRRLRREA